MRVVTSQLGLVDYEKCFEAMKAISVKKSPESLDQIWFLEHFPVITLGKSAKENNILLSGTIPIVKTDRGGDVTYHGPGQLVVYFMINVKKLGFGPREFVIRLENSVINCLADFGAEAYGRRDAPGVYIKDKKIASLGLRFTRGYSYHGIALNVCMDLSPFTRINTCGYIDLEVTQLSNFCNNISVKEVSVALKNYILKEIYTSEVEEEIVSVNLDSKMVNGE